ncbi:MAG: RNA methyltransferase [Desulfurococcaceae archaeon]|nr:RNA methyltransferase [Desulfurococcaceae archaeon]
MRIRVVLVGIEGAVNLGLIARTCVNFDVDELYLVSPVASIDEALKYAAGGRDLLLRSIVTSSLEEALKGVHISVATSAIGYSECDVVRQAIAIEDFAEKIYPRAEKIAVVFGRESTGLTREEILKTDFLVTIPASLKYPVLNVSQAVAIFLWELWKREKKVAANIPPRASREDVTKLLSILERIIGLTVSSEDKKRRCNLVLKRTLMRSLPSQYELKVLLYLARRLIRKLEAGGSSLNKL